MGDLPIADLTSESAETRLQATSAIADACERGTPLDAAAEPVIALLADPDSKVSGMAGYILQTDAERDPSGRGAAALRAALTSDVIAVRRGAATLLAGCLAREENGAAVAALIDTPDPAVRLGAITALAEGARPRAQIDAVVSSLVNALADDELRVRKEATWALYLFGSDGADVQSAVPALERMLDDPSTQGNAAIVISLALHTANDATRADALARHPSLLVQSGAAWGAATVYLRRSDVAALKTLFSSDSADVRRGLGGYLHHARGRGRDLSPAGQAFLELQRDHPDDALLHARLFAVQEIIERGPPERS
ncbi:hypothetical protein BH11MYX3_BH11MYX3_31140 [soil metagenome]